MCHAYSDSCLLNSSRLECQKPLPEFGNLLGMLVSTRDSTNSTKPKVLIHTARTSLNILVTRSTDYILKSTLHLPTTIQVDGEGFNADSDGSTPKDVDVTEHEDVSYAEEDPSGPPNCNGETLSEPGGILTGQDLPSESPEIEHDTVELRAIHDHEEISVPLWTFRFLNMQLVLILFLALTDILS
ncbi:hypothetical protein K438DRAFT_1786227 [Mycena galopus ATCC 62051]|nr:hypothetical protein K438DRAFT_1786227 [Mycena galopus ATCC 62051]